MMLFNVKVLTFVKSQNDPIFRKLSHINDRISSISSNGRYTLKSRLI